MPSKLEQMQMQFRQKLQQEKEGKQMGQSSLPRPSGTNGAVPKNGTTVTSIRQTNTVVKTTTQTSNGTKPKPVSTVNSSNGVRPSASSSQPVAKPKPVAKVTTTVQQATVAQSRVKVSNTGSGTTMMTTAQLQSLKATMVSKNGDHVDAAKTTKTTSKAVAQKTVTRTETKPALTVVKKAVEKPVEQKPLRKTAPQPALASSSLGTTSRSTTLSAKPALAKTSSKPAPKSTFTSSAAAKKPASSRQAPIAPRKVDPNLAQCRICGRSFAKDRVEKHETVCEKASKKKTKVFDVTKMRTKGTEQEKFVKLGFHKKDVPVKKSNWRAKHEDFINTIRQAKILKEHLAAGGKLSDLPPPPPSENPDYVPCPHCGRKFNEAAAERHIPRCKNISSNKKSSKK